MLQRLIDDLQARTGSAVRQTTLAAATAFCLLVATSFLAAAAFIFVLQREGAVKACLASGATFLIVAMIAGIGYMVRQRNERRRLELAAREAAHSARSAASSILSDPATLAIGLQVVRTIGVRRLIPLLAIGGIAFGFMASQRARAGVEPAE